MTGRHVGKRNGQSRSVRARRCRLAGLVGSAGAFLAVGLGPSGMGRAADADGLDGIVDPVISSLSSVDPLLGADVSTSVGDFTTSSGWDTVLADLSGVDSAL